MKQPVLLCIMDGFGIAGPEANAIAAAKTPRLDALFAQYPHTQIGASGMEVGLPEGQMGNSEVGHTNIGAGRVVYQELTRISKSIADGDFFANPALLAAIDNAKQGKALHLLGLVSDGGVHSHNTHLYALLELAKRHGLQNVYIHALLDGRDVPPSSGKGFAEALFAKTRELGVGQIATIAGRYYGMDRERKWDRVQKLYDAMVHGRGPRFACGGEYIQASYDAGVTDEFVVPAIAEQASAVQPGDSLVFFNFRPDRAREITRAFVDPDFSEFPRKNLRLTYVCMTQYDATMPNVKVAYQPQSLNHVLGAILSEQGLRQLRIAEYTKYAHVTFFLNGGEETVYPGEDRVMIDSPNVATYDLQPQMSAYQVADKVVEVIEQALYDVIVLNFANCDMVGHTGLFGAAVEAVEAVDACVGRVWAALHAKNGVLLLTADHGNADHMAEPDGSPFTAHTTNPVPFLVGGYDCKLKPGGKLSDIAPTLLQVLGIAQPAEMTGESLLQK
ncbi:MAG: 2,3-bisphosphoglycerate-independent phosphoglycerate mutase [Oscillospiraceae bacterium]|jgi:2,3-bisphosphoglycerate-independent phosphoglycerate mutase|nr:2,3-bisphosphoglycerate-independent phosphoglycerate mutase [Oscillospiraceae bacterium]